MIEIGFPVPPRWYRWLAFARLLVLCLFMHVSYPASLTLRTQENRAHVRTAHPLVSQCADYAAEHSDCGAENRLCHASAGSRPTSSLHRQAVELLLRGADVMARERELIRAVPEMDTINAMLGGVKISVPGLARAVQAAKKGRRGAKH